MGKAARRKREAREGRPKLDTRHPWWSIYSRVYMWLAQVEREVRDESSGPLFNAIKMAHVVYVDPLQASAAPAPASWTDMLPFPVVLLAIGDESGDLQAPPYAALMVDQRQARVSIDPDAYPAEHDIAIFPLYLKAGRINWRGLGLVIDGDLTTTAFSDWPTDRGLREEDLREDQVTRDGAAVALGALDLLRSVNVDLRPSVPAPRAHRAEGVPGFEIVVRQHSGARQSRGEPSAMDWSHRWEVRGHYKHFTRGPIFDANADRRVDHDGEECVRVWCPPFVKGPDDKPFVPKVRTTALHGEGQRS